MGNWPSARIHGREPLRPPAFPAESGRPRLLWLDLSRGTAIVFMVFAHTWPWGGLWAIVEYVTAPWFALLIGISLSLVWQRHRHRPVLFLVDSLVRGLLLILLGVALQGTYDQIVVVLQTWGGLLIVLAPLLGLMGGRPTAAIVVSAVLAVASPVLMTAGRGWITSLTTTSTISVQIVDLLVAGHYYRVTSFLAVAAAGVAFTPALTRRQPLRNRRGLLVSLGLFATSAVVYAVGTLTPGGAEPDSGTTPEIVGSILLSLSATWFCLWLVNALGEGSVRKWLGPVVATGRMSLTAYTIQILALATITGLLLPGQRDDHWWVTALVTTLCLASSWLWMRIFRRGPLEFLIRAPGRLARSAWSRT